MVVSINQFLGNMHKKRDEFQFNRRMARARKALAPTEFTHYPSPTTQGDANQGFRLSQGEFLLEQDMLSFDVEKGIWSISFPNIHMMRRFHAMNWMDDLAAANTTKANKRLQEWTLQWIEQYYAGPRTVWSDDLVGWRLIRFTTHAFKIIGGLQEVRQERFFESLAVHQNFLNEVEYNGDPNVTNFVIATARVFGALALTNYRDGLAEHIDALNKISLDLVDERFLFLKSRRPDHLAQIFSLLVWADTALSEEGFSIGRHHDHAIDILGASVRSLRYLDRTLLQAHGSGIGDADVIERAISSAQVQGVNHDDRVLGYASVTANQLAVFMDCEAPPSERDESTAHASTLALWVTDGGNPIIGSMGSAINHGLQARFASQETRAHSSLTIEEQSSSELTPPNPELGEGAVGAYITQPANVATFTKTTDNDATEIWANHNGFLSRYGIIHERRLHVERDGRYFAGVDYLHPPEGEDARIKQILKQRGEHGINFQIRFHLGPGIEPSLDLKGQAASFIDPKTRQLWVVRQVGTAVQIEDSVYYDSRRLRPTPTKVLVLHSRLVEPTGYISWSFQVS